jgi:predicted TIM-barrel fold metal-dependent hydrolase
VLHQGLIGVKLYPVMGFYPLGNEAAEAAGETYPGELMAIANWGRKLDDNLKALYEFCLSHDVPIMAHCSLSQYPSLDAGKRASPSAWERLLESDSGRFRTLRLNLAHFGGLWDLAKDAPEATATWTMALAQILNGDRYPNLYADVADYDAVIEYPTDQIERNGKVMEQLKRALPQGAAGRRKILYGSDWVMLSRAAYTDRYYPQMKRSIMARLDLTKSENDGFLGGNAARFLGLARSAELVPKTRQRLEAFYNAHGLDPQRLRHFDT